ncbi:BCCT family transporter [Rothia amarae]|uniref:BCCT family transporter n=1 Tax=Rothia amarae TaxID=169480 RepID=A0A7H2BHE9_9MICC|nr:MULTISPECIES: BCCT family transporter [Rothia]QNV39095.1 BCCT family transporter [Rothia amarae]SIK96368.1 glycine/betaine ABC transporter [Mycobacteroides abscessus subsp. abscessus]
MLLKLHDRLGLRTNPPIFFTTAGFIALFTLSFIAFPTQMEGVFGAMAQWIITYFGWFYVLGNALFFIFLVYLAASRFGRVKLGPDDSVPQYSGVAWFGMLFAAGVGAVLLFWGAAEPISHFANPPYDGVEPQSDRAARDALAISNFHIGLFMWVILTVPGLAFGYFTYKRKLPPRVSSIFQPILGEGIHGPLGKMIDALAIISTVFGLAVSVGLGALQINSGLQILYGVPYVGWIQAGIIALVTAAGITSVVAGMDKGVKRLSYFNILMAVALLLFILMAGATRTVLMGTIESAGYFLMRLPEMMFFNDAFADTGWIGSWTVFYWAWTVSWAPFVGLFIARISQGRTIREFVIGVLAVPSIFVMFWIGIFGMNAFDIERNQNGQLIENVVDKGDIPAALFEFLGHFPLFEFVAPFTVLVITIFFITSIDSAALTMDAIANGHEDKAPKRQRVFWALCIGVVCAVILVTTGDSGLDILQHVIIVVGFPVFILGFLQMWMVIRALREDAGEVAPMRTRQWKQVIPAEEYRRRAREDFSSVQEVVIRPEFEEGTEPEFEARVPNTGQIRAVKADSKTEKSSSTSAE